MRKTSLQIVITIIFVFFSISGCFGECRLVTANGIKGLIMLDEGELFAEKRHNMSDIGIHYSMHEGKINTITISGSDFCAKEGIRVGDSIERFKERIKEIVGEGHLLKGSNAVGSFNRYVTQEGIYLIVTNRLVTALVISD